MKFLFYNNLHCCKANTWIQEQGSDKLGKTGFLTTILEYKENQEKHGKNQGKHRDFLNVFGTSFKKKVCNKMKCFIALDSSRQILQMILYQGVNQKITIGVVRPHLGKRA